MGEVLVVGRFGTTTLVSHDRLCDGLERVSVRYPSGLWPTNSQGFGCSPIPSPALSLQVLSLLGYRVFLSGGVDLIRGGDLIGSVSPIVVELLA